ncbi:MAG: hypothetical protein ACF8MF_06680 [Phycisphaerales bacterium JB052]
MFEDLQMYLFEAILEKFGDIEYPVGRDRIVAIQAVAEKAMAEWVRTNCTPLDISTGWRLRLLDEEGDCMLNLVFAEFAVSVIYDWKEEALDVVPMLGHILFPAGRPSLNKQPNRAAHCARCAKSLLKE